MNLRLSRRHGSARLVSVRFEGQRCPICRDSFAPREALVVCRACSTVCHEECALAGCPVLGCDTGAPPPPRRPALRALSLALALSALLGLVLLLLLVQERAPRRHRHALRGRPVAPVQVRGPIDRMPGQLAPLSFVWSAQPSGEHLRIAGQAQGPGRAEIRLDGQPTLLLDVQPGPFSALVALPASARAVRVWFTPEASSAPQLWGVWEAKTR